MSFIRTIFGQFGTHIKGDFLQVDDEIKFVSTANPELDTEGGNFLHKLKTAVTTALRWRDDTKGQDIITVDTLNDIVTANNTDYSFVGFGSNIAFTIQSTNYNAVADDWVDMTTGATNKTVTFPATPSTDDRIKVSKADAGAGNVDIAGNGNNINGSATDLITSQYTVVTYQYNGTEWRKY